MPVLKSLGKPMEYYKYNKNGDAYYKNEESIEKVIRYITRTRMNETRADELISVGGCGVTFNYGTHYIVEQIIQTQEIYDIEDKCGRRLYHETLSFSDDEVLFLGDLKLLDDIAYETCRYYYNKGFESLYAVHYGETNHYHIHIVHNSVNFMNGRKYHQDVNEMYEKRAVFDHIVRSAFVKANLMRTMNGIPIKPVVIGKALALKKNSSEEGVDGYYGYIAS